MAFNIILKINNSENNKINKDTTTVATISGTLRDKCSVIDPVILLEGNVSNYAGYNYLEIPTFKRKYFIRNITSVREGLVEVECHCDVLSSFATAILENYGIVRKSTNSWNLYLNDGSLRVNQYADYKCLYFPNGFNHQEFVLAVAGG